MHLTVTAKDYLASLHTRQLLKLRDKAYAVSNAGGLLAPDRMAFVDVSPTLSVSVADIKGELATRPHVPNKAEAKKQRQQAAHEKKNR